MTPIFLIMLLALVIGASALVLWVAIARQRRRLGLPAGRLLSQDSRDTPTITLVARTLPLRGKPDLVLQTGRAIIPVELKTGRTPSRPYLGHVLQLSAYCLLIEEHYGVRPTHGIIRYPDRHFDVPYTKEQEHALRDLVAEMVEQKRTGKELHRSHQSPPVCAGCGFQQQCPEAL